MIKQKLDVIKIFLAALPIIGMVIGLIAFVHVRQDIVIKTITPSPIHLKQNTLSPTKTISISQTPHHPTVTTTLHPVITATSNQTSTTPKIVTLSLTPTITLTTTITPSIEP